MTKWLPSVAVAALLAAGLPASAQAPAQAPAQPPAPAPEQAPSDLLNAVLWMQRSVEYKANALTAFALARIRLDEALADKTWTAAPAEQTGDFASLPPAVILDADETLLDNSTYQAWLAKTGSSFSQRTWTEYVKSETTGALPGAVDFARYADSKGVKVFYLSNRLAEGEEEPTRRNMEKLGFPGGGNVDVFLTTRKKPDWTSAKSTRRAYVAKEYRVLLNVGDNLGDFTDAYRGNAADRLKVFNDNEARWGREWIMLANPAYGSFESEPFGADYKLSVAEQRKAKMDALQPWAGPR